MAERAHPNEPGFQSPSPYRDAFFWRYDWASSFCADKDVLDVPCGMGWGTSLLRGCRQLRGLDISPEAVSEARERYGAVAEFMQGTMRSLPYPDHSLDVVVCLEGIEHVSTAVASAFLSDTWRVLRPHGLLLLSSPECLTGPHSGNPYHIVEYSLDELTDLMSPWFDVAGLTSRQVDCLLVHYVHATRKTVPDDEHTRLTRNRKRRTQTPPHTVGSRQTSAEDQSIRSDHQSNDPPERTQVAMDVEVTKG